MYLRSKQLTRGGDTMRKRLVQFVGKVKDLRPALAAQMKKVAPVTSRNDN